MALGAGGCTVDQGTDSSEASNALVVNDPLLPLNYSVAEHPATGRVEEANVAQWTFTDALPHEISPFTSGPVEKSQVEVVRESLAAMASDVEIELTFELEGPDLEPLPAEDAARTGAIALYRAALQPAFAAFEAKASNLGLKVFGHTWLTRAVTIRGKVEELLPLAHDASVANLSVGGETIAFADHDLCSVSLSGGAIGWDGFTWRAGSTQQDESKFLTSWSGDTGGRAGGRVRLAVVDHGWPVRSHRSYRFGPSSPTADRILVSKLCSPSSCTTSTPSGHWSHHGHRVAQWALGSVENGQDPNCDAFTRHFRSASRASGAHLLYYESLDGGCAGVRLAIEDAVAQGADIVNLSIGALTCNPSFDCGGLNAAVTNATNQGTLIVGSAGNEGLWFGGNGCMLGHPQIRSEVLTVGGLNTENRSWNYNSLDRHAKSSKGGIFISLANGQYGYDAGLDLMAPFVVNYDGTTHASLGGISRYANSGSAGVGFGGTSAASPMIAGSAARVLDGFKSLGWAQNARTLRINLSLMGDAAIGPSTDMLFSVDWRWGFGRLHAKVPAAGWAASPNGWVQSPFTLQPGQTALGCVNNCQPMPSSVRQVNWVVFHEDADMSQVPVVTIRIVDLNTGASIRSDATTSMTKRVQLRGEEIWGRRLQLQVIPYAVNAPLPVYSGHFFHSDPSGHTNH